MDSLDSVSTPQRLPLNVDLLSGRFVPWGGSRPQQHSSLDIYPICLETPFPINSSKSFGVNSIGLTWAWCQSMSQSLWSGRWSGSSNRCLDSWNEDEGGPLKKLGLCCLENKKGKWMEGRAGTHNRHPLQSPPPPPKARPRPCPGEPKACPLPLGQLGCTWRVPLVGSFPLGSLLTHTLCLCFHRIFSLLIYMETPKR